MNVKERLVRFRSFWIFPLFAIVLSYFTFRNDPQRHVRDLAWLFPLGVLCWSLLEYGLHRFIFHARLHINNLKTRDLLNASHLTHHAAPRDPDKVLVHTPFALAISVLLYGLFFLVLGRSSLAAGVMNGVWGGFLYYEAVHYRVHLGLSDSRVIALQRRAHFYHHFTNSERCFGVTSPLWDYVFGTQLPRRPR